MTYIASVSHCSAPIFVPQFTLNSTFTNHEIDIPCSTKAISARSIECISTGQDASTGTYTTKETQHYNIYQRRYYPKINPPGRQEHPNRIPDRVATSPQASPAFWIWGRNFWADRHGILVFKVLANLFMLCSICFMLYVGLVMYFARKSRLHDPIINTYARPSAGDIQFDMVRDVLNWIPFDEITYPPPAYQPRSWHNEIEQQECALPRYTRYEVKQGDI